MNPFNPLEVPLTGINLIEAAAGTGKTFTVEVIYLRLLIEAQLNVENILVVTYTVAATEELRERIRNRIKKAADALNTQEGEDPFIEALLKKYPHPEERLKIYEYLKSALWGFDEAAIYTIHGFCQRMLKDYAFECGYPFDMSLIPDEEFLKEEIVHDFWRKHMYKTYPEFIDYATSVKFTPTSLKVLYSKISNHPRLKILSEPSPPDKNSLEGKIATYRMLVRNIKDLWQTEKDEVVSLLKSPALDGRSYGKAVPGLTDLMDYFLESEAFFLLTGEKDSLQKFSQKHINDKVRKRYRAPEHPFFNLFDKLWETVTLLKADFDQYLRFLKGTFLAEAKQMLAEKKRKRNVLSFQDLLVMFNEALLKEGNERLKEIIGRKYKAALIDEFQDTDPVQFSIFQRLFGKGDHILFFIGDPKQAIYSFRGADVFTYMRASNQCQAKYTLQGNRRSTPDLVQAVNTIFTLRDNPFLYENIQFCPDYAAGKDEPVDFVWQGQKCSPLVLWFLPSENVRRTKVKIADAIAREVSRLLGFAEGGVAYLGERPVEPKDIAVLVRKHEEAQLIKEVLNERGIPAVIQKTGHIFSSQEAKQLMILLAALAMPEEDGYVRAALLTDFFNTRGADLERWEEEGGPPPSVQEKFFRYRDLWLEKGFMTMFLTFLAEEKVKVRLLSFVDGERRLTNVLHLAELLHQKSESAKLGLINLYTWFTTQIQRWDDLTEKEYEMRIESDEDALQIVTIHSSKGLEYPIVFCPFLFDPPTENKRDVFLFHEWPEEETLLCAFRESLADDQKRKFEKECLAEELRLLYVALTRAKVRLYLCWANKKGAEDSALGYLLSGLDGAITTNDEAMFRSLERLAARAEGRIEVCSLPEGEKISSLQGKREEPLLTFRPFKGSIDHSWGIASFSSLISGVKDMGEQPDYDGTMYEDISVPLEEGKSIFTFPRGIKTGIFFHEILRQIDFQDPVSETTRLLIRRQLVTQGFSGEWEEVVVEVLRQLTLVKLPWDNESICLAQVDKKNCLREIAFTFPLRRLETSSLTSLLHRLNMTAHKDTWEWEGGRLRFNPVEGYMRGFIDLVFVYRGRYFLVDWKSNFLGERWEDYSGEALERAMVQNYYHLQYLLYTLALHLYLGKRLSHYCYDEHFGGVYYVFLRGLAPFGPNGIFSTKPEEGLLNELKGLLL